MGRKGTLGGHQEHSVHSPARLSGHIHPGPAPANQYGGHVCVGTN